MMFRLDPENPDTGKTIPDCAEALYPGGRDPAMMAEAIVRLVHQGKLPRKRLRSCGRL